MKYLNGLRREDGSFIIIACLAGIQAFYLGANSVMWLLHVFGQSIPPARRGFQVIGPLWGIELFTKAGMDVLAAIADLPTNPGAGVYLPLMDVTALVVCVASIQFGNRHGRARTIAEIGFMASSLLTSMFLAILTNRLACVVMGIAGLWGFLDTIALMTGVATIALFFTNRHKFDIP